MRLEEETVNLLERLNMRERNVREWSETGSEGAGTTRRNQKNTKIYDWYTEGE